MPCRVAYLAEQNCRKSAEARLDIELRKVYKLQAHNQEIAHNNARLQQQLRAAKNEVPLLTALDSLHLLIGHVHSLCDRQAAPLHTLRRDFAAD